MPDTREDISRKITQAMLGQECIVYYGGHNAALGRVRYKRDEFPDQYIAVQTYHDNRIGHYAPHNVTLIHPNIHPGS